MMQQHSADHGPDGGTERERRRPDADGQRLLARVGEHDSDERQARREQCGPADAHQRPGADQRQRSRRECCQHRGCGEKCCTPEHKATTSPAVAQIAHGDEQTGEQESVHV
ncbi:Uncharacterised protein [Mycobacteroides abscessus subsp. abscessus]|nr:Uncharacterised protein [Mycobacteroides abscessus subsp. abscessus]